MRTDFAAGSLPPLRLILWPHAGLGVEVVLRLSRWFNCFMAAEAFVHGESHVLFGLQPRHASWLRLSLAPSCRLSLRVPVLRMSEFKVLWAGSSATFMSGGRVNPVLTSSTSPSWKSFCQMLRPALEIQHHPTILSALFDDDTRQAIRDSLREIKRTREYGREFGGHDHDFSVKRFNPQDLPTLDPRQGVSDSMRQAGTLRRRSSQELESSDGTLRPRAVQTPSGDFNGEIQNSRQNPGFVATLQLPGYCCLGEARALGDQDRMYIWK